MAGRPLTRSDVDHAVGQAFLDLNVAMNQLNLLRDNLRKRGPEALLAAGYEQAEVDLIMGALDDGNQLYNIYRGAQSGTLTSPKDFRDRAVLLWGLGVR